MAAAHKMEGVDTGADAEEAVEEAEGAEGAGEDGDDDENDEEEDMEEDEEEPRVSAEALVQLQLAWPVILNFVAYRVP